MGDEFLDVSLPVREGMFPIAEASDVRFTRLAGHDSPGGMLETQLRMSCHAGTHVDYPSHVDPGSRAFSFMEDAFRDDIFPGNTFTLAYFLTFDDKRPTGVLDEGEWRWGEEIPADEVEAWFDRFDEKYPDFPHERVRGALLRTGWNDRWFEPDFWRRGGPTLSDDAARYLMSRGLRYLASDFAFTFEPGRTHDIVMRDNDTPRFQVEGLCNLGALESDVVGLLVAPLKLQGCEGLPARVFATDVDLSLFGAGRPGVREWHHTSLSVTDLDRATGFYGEAFGYEVLFEARGMTGQMADITGVPGLECDLAQMSSSLSDHVLELVEFRDYEGEGGESAAPLRPGAAHLAFVVEDLEAEIERVGRLGAEVLGGVVEFDEGRSAYCREPSGTVFELEELFDNGGS